MATYVHLNSTCILEQALLLKYQQPPHIPRGANHDPGQAPIQPPDGMQIGSGEFRQIQVWLHEMFPKWWPLPHEEFNQHVASIREAVHNACHAMDYGYLDEIRAFFMHLQPLVDHFFANEGYSRRQGIPRGDDDRDSQSMDLDLSHNTQTTVQVEEMEMDIDNDDEMNNASYFHALAMLFSRTLPLEQRGSRKKVAKNACCLMAVRAN
ncbi:uncharacterized protein BDV17DRAFT_292528 [Aspergillus undulatus]|uniref:uncharacterized protein n=1 Tax=Aspergillus undulatus TaxID=1810928 RepID=UPI003CCD7E31